MRQYKFAMLGLALAVSAPALAEDDFSAVEERILPLHSSRVDPWFLVVPPSEAHHPGLEATPAMLERARKRNAGNPQFRGVLDAVVAHAERLLEIPQNERQAAEEGFRAQPQQQGLGDKQLLGIGIFMPHKGIDAVNKKQEN